MERKLFYCYVYTINISQHLNLTLCKIRKERVVTFKYSKLAAHNGSNNPSLLFFKTVLARCLVLVRREKQELIYAFPLDSAFVTINPNKCETNSLENCKMILPVLLRGT